VLGPHGSALIKHFATLRKGKRFSRKKVGKRQSRQRKVESIANMNGLQLLCFILAIALVHSKSMDSHGHSKCNLRADYVAAYCENRLPDADQVFAQHDFDLGACNSWLKTQCAKGLNDGQGTLEGRASNFMLLVCLEKNRRGDNEIDEKDEKEENDK
jgi:hypothetical protein